MENTTILHYAFCICSAERQTGIGLLLTKLELTK